MSDMFPKSAPLRLDYRPEQVNRYLETAHRIYDAGELSETGSEGVHIVAFGIVLHGYQPQAADAAPDWFEIIFPQRRRAAFVAKDGRQAWTDQVTQLATTLYSCLLHLAGERFALTSGQGYNKTDVDTFMDYITGYFDFNIILTSSGVRGAVFRRARGNKACGESSVDRCLVRVIEALLFVE